MPYTNSWSNGIPAVGSLAKLIGTFFRSLRLDVFERMNSLVIDWTADPVVLKDELSGKATALTRIVPFSSFLSDLNAKENLISSGSIFGFVGSGPYIAAVDIPPGCTITKMEYILNINTAASVTCELQKQAFTAVPTVTPVDTKSCNTAGMTVYSSTLGVPELIDPDFSYFIELNGTGVAGHSFEFVAARITFDRDSNAHST